MAITYQLGDSIYINLTNRCTNQCQFCIRNYQDGVGGYNLWLAEEPTAAEVIEEIEDPTSYQEVVFCGYGEPLIRLETLLEVANWLQEFDTSVRIDTNGQANLIHQDNIAPKLEGLVDTISISLNAKNASKYQQLCNSDFGSSAFEAILEFTQECKKYIPQVILTVVNNSLVDIYECRKIAKNLGVDFKIREFSQRNKC
ncbi:TatD family nuclease-associated radical SAM protein [Fuchsiella alkaliacetigena]|uniref:TatD family nuclease-associated radical SAM protein n=1 Tax=Fuchsiella alkaliacetigena TaxID=957042 RepID=UPI00200AEFAF|nr:TatD family nuclease-associated radical SAM protein [Fuchsiella alkaliacetigena]MCK8824999.1 TatD family nuclease-associated radical SAM protein [Fuchsiella alkaliacetigena]